MSLSDLDHSMLAELPVTSTANIMIEVSPCWRCSRVDGLCARWYRMLHIRDSRLQERLEMINDYVFGVTNEVRLHIMLTMRRKSSRAHRIYESHFLSDKPTAKMTSF